MKNKIIAVSTAAALCIPSVIYAQSRFIDMNGYEWAEESVESLYEKGIVTGVSETQYSPSAQIKRGDFALMTARCFNLANSGGENFADVKKDKYYADAILALKNISAYTGENFEPERTVTREEAIGIIYNTIYNTTGVAEEYFSEDAAQFYSDASEIKWDKVNAAATLTKMGIIEGDNGKFNPKNTMTRAEMAVLFFNLEEFKNTEAVSDDIEDKEDIKAKIRITSDVSEDNKQYLSTDNDESVVFLDNASYTGLSITVSKAGGESSDGAKSRVYGLNSAFFAKNATAYLQSASVMSSANNSDALFAASKSFVNVTNSALVSTGNYSSAASAAENSEIGINNTRLSTAGEESPVIKSLYTGNISCEGVYVMTSADTSCGIYSAGKTVVNNSTISIDKGYIAKVDGMGDMSLFGTTASGKGIMLLQSGIEGTFDGMGKFSAYNSRISSNAEALFYVTNTDAQINLTASEIIIPSNGILLKAEAAQWGKADSNGGHASINATNQALTGDIVTDGISSATLNLIGKSSYRGALNAVNYTGAMNVSLSGESTWSLTGDSYVTAFENENNACTNIKSNGYSIYYDPSAAANKWLEGKTISLDGGGVLKPVY